MSTPASREPMFPFRTVVLGALIPAFIFSTGIGAMIPVLVSFSVERGATIALAGVIAAMLPIGQIVADLPAGALASRIGDRRAMLIAGAFAAAGFLAAGFAPSLLTLGAAIFLVGAANAVFHLARHSYLTEVTNPLQRARVLSTLGGVHRIGQFAGPFLGAALTLGGDLRWVFALAAVTSLAAVATVFTARAAKGEDDPDQRTHRAGTPPVRLKQVLRDYRHLLLTLGMCGMFVGAIRGAKQQVLPLWGEHIGLDPTTISLIYGISSGIDMLLFYPAGKVMDSFGRLWVGVPAMLALGAAIAMVPLSSTAAQLAVAGIFTGFANGMGSGIMMTISSDIAPAEARPQFLGAWRVLTDIGIGLGPLTLAAGAALGSLAIGVLIAASYGPMGAAIMQRWLPRYSDHANRSTRRRAGITR
ncbi:MFS transporter [Nesterenkonia flava]|uniref:MFS transporter n=1 Tax=Nesterenkonia flava TaxID=469799 RepID=A0ABU1FSS3_9MICC|nr:MFS transporter [Nesterenkonia flava]MDR5711277.1 MFS transporter [Nesterenkonia flava]